MVNYTTGDILIRIKNAAIARIKELEISDTKNNLAIVKALVRLDYLESAEKSGKNLKLKLTFSHKKPVLMNITLVSKPGLRIYKSVTELKKIRKPSTLLISTPLGVLSLKEALAKNVGGEVYAEVL